MNNIETTVQEMIERLEGVRSRQEFPRLTAIQVFAYEKQIREYFELFPESNFQEFYSFLATGMFAPNCQGKTPEIKGRSFYWWNAYTSVGDYSKVTIYQLADALIDALNFEDDSEGSARRELIDTWYEDYDEEDCMGVPLTNQQYQQLLENIREGK